MSNKPIIKIDFCGFWGSFNKKDNLFVRMLSKSFNIELSDEPDFVICSNRGKPFEYMKYDCVRIMFMGEPISPDFTAFDYVIGFDYIKFGDRYFRLPFGFYFDDGNPWIPEKLSYEQAKDILQRKQYFCNFVYGHESPSGMREELFYELQKYKKVVSPGSYLNNINDNKKRCSWQEKYEYVKLSKFTIAGDSIHYPGFVTEKIVQPFIYHSIPIYAGSTRVYEDFNKDAFVCYEHYNEIDKVIKEVQYLDTHDEAYISMLMEQPLVKEDYIKGKYEQLEKYLYNIFSQDPKVAFRRIKHLCSQLHESYLKEYMEKRKKEKLVERVRKAIKR